METRALVLLCLLVTACSGGDEPAACGAPPAVAEANCSTTGNCAVIQIAGDAPDGNLGTFKGFADPSLANDSDVAGQVWLAYAWPHVVAGQATDGSTVQMAAAENRLARSDEGGMTFALVHRDRRDLAGTFRRKLDDSRLRAAALATSEI